MRGGSKSSVGCCNQAQSPRYRLLKRVWTEVREDVNATGVDRQEILCWTIHQLMAAAGEGVKNKQPSVTVGACRELDALLETVPAIRVLVLDTESKDSAAARRVLRGKEA